MRLLVPVLVAFALGCSPTTTEVREPPEASTPDPDADIPDAWVDSDTADAGATCPSDASSPTCAPTGGSCGPGRVYGCYGAGCPIGEVGSCQLLSSNGVGYSEFCCAAAACVRATAPLDAECRERFDAGVGELRGWTCPYANGRQLAKPPGSCMLNGLPAPDSTSVAGEFCCR